MEKKEEKRKNNVAPITSQAGGGKERGPKSVDSLKKRRVLRLQEETVHKGIELGGWSHEGRGRGKVGGKHGQSPEAVGGKTRGKARKTIL